MVFDLDQLEKWSHRTGGTIKPPIVNLGYINLSRSRASTIVMLEGEEDSEIENFLLETFTHATSLALKAQK